MKKLGIPLFLAGFLLLAPIARASDGSWASSLEEVIDQLVTLLLGEETELGPNSPPTSQNLAGDEPELGLACPPGG